MTMAMPFQQRSSKSFLHQGNLVVSTVTSKLKAPGLTSRKAMRGFVCRFCMYCHCLHGFPSMQIWGQHGQHLIQNVLAVRPPFYPRPHNVIMSCLYIKVYLYLRANPNLYRFLNESLPDFILGLACLLGIHPG